MNLEKLTLVGQFILPKVENGKEKRVLIQSEEIFTFTLLEFGFGVQGVQYTRDNEINLKNGKELYTVRVDLVPGGNEPLSIKRLGEYLERHHISFTGNVFFESSL